MTALLDTGLLLAVLDASDDLTEPRSHEEREENHENPLRPLRLRGESGVFAVDSYVVSVKSVLSVDERPCVK